METEGSVVEKKCVVKEDEIQKIKIVGVYISWSNMFGLMFQAGMCSIPVGVAVFFAYTAIIRTLGEFL